ncbi:hypothetical protein ATCC90586_010506 [Pythium insidiosum]|nr:hypothetical protein ATCC90586_010506 [Pythium insidiosum]
MSSPAAYLRQLEVRRLLRDLQAALDHLSLELHRRTSRSSLPDGFGTAEAASFIGLLESLGRSLAGAAPVPAVARAAVPQVAATDDSAARELVTLRARVATLTTERDRLTAELKHASSRARIRDTRPSDALRARLDDAEAEIVRLNDRVTTLQSALAEFERLGTAATLAGIVRRYDVYRRLGDPIELEAFVESAQAESAMLRAVVRELTVEIGWYEDLLGPMVLSLSRQEALVSSLVRAACAPPLPAGTAVQPLSPPALPRMVSAIVGVIPDDIARSPPTTAAALERLEMALADRDAERDSEPADRSRLADPHRRLLCRVRDALRAHPSLDDVAALRRHIDSACQASGLAEIRDRAQRRSLISAARAAAASRGSSVARAVLRADLQYQIPDEGQRPATSVAPVAQCQRPATSTAAAASSVGRPKRPASPAVSSRSSKVARKSSTRSAATAASARPPAGDDHGQVAPDRHQAAGRVHC